MLTHHKVRELLVTQRTQLINALRGHLAEIGVIAAQGSTNAHDLAELIEEGDEAIAAAVFPLSSPMAMLARAAQDPAWVPQIVAIVWQAVWVALILRVGSRLFRKTVLKSGPRTKWWRRAQKTLDVGGGV